MAISQDKRDKIEVYNEDGTTTEYSMSGRKRIRKILI